MKSFLFWHAKLANTIAVQTWRKACIIFIIYEHIWMYPHTYQMLVQAINIYIFSHLRQMNSAIPPGLILKVHEEADQVSVVKLVLRTDKLSPLFWNAAGDGTPWSTLKISCELLWALKS